MESFPLHIKLENECSPQIYEVLLHVRGTNGGMNGEKLAGDKTFLLNMRKTV